MYKHDIIGFDANTKSTPHNKVFILMKIKKN